MTAIALREGSNGEPVVTCETLTQVLGYQNKSDLCHMIARHRAEIETHGFLVRVPEYSEGRGRPRLIYHLNEKQALLVAVLSHTPPAMAARKALIDTFAAWRNGTLKPYKPAPAPSPVGTPLGVEEFSLRQTADGAYLVTFTTRRFDVARLVTEACLAPLLA